MDMSLDTSRVQPPGVPLGEPAVVVWHELECGRYTADMELWRELAREARTAGAAADNVAILDVGAGSGRVSLALAREGHELTALDLDPVLLAALERRARKAALGVATVCADARHFTLAERDFELCLIPMQTIQLLGGADGRRAFLRSARAHLRPGAVLACAIVTELEPFHCGHGDSGPSPEVASVNGREYSSRATSVQIDDAHIRIERVRTIAAVGAERASSERNVIELDRVSTAELQREGRSVGFDPLPVRTIGETAEHVGSEVVVLRV